MKQATVRCRYCGKEIVGINPCSCGGIGKDNKKIVIWDTKGRKKQRKLETQKIMTPIAKKRKKYFYDTIEKENEDWHNNKNPLVRLFYRMKFKIAIFYAELKKDDLILDFGCGAGQLKKMLPGYNVVGYDIDPKLTEIKDYTQIKPDKIFALDVFEHIPNSGIKKIIINFRKMNPNVVLVTAIPTETWLWRKMRKIMGLSETVADHVTPLKKILGILENQLKLERKVNYVLMSHIARWKK